MSEFDFYDIEKLVDEGVDDKLLRQLIVEANRYKVARAGRLTEAFKGKGFPILDSGRPSSWDEQLDSFVESHFKFSGQFNTGELVINHSTNPSAPDWYKKLVGLEAKVIRGWTEPEQKTWYEIEICWNKHRGVCTEHELLKNAEYDAPWWCAEVIQERRHQLYVRLAPFNNVNTTLDELCGFVSTMAKYNSSKLHLCAKGKKDCRFSIEYNSRLSFYAAGKRSNRKAIIEILKALKSD